MEYVDKEMIGLLYEKLRKKPFGEWSYKVKERYYSDEKSYFSYQTTLSLDFGKEKKDFIATVKRKEEKRRFIDKNEYWLSLDGIGDSAGSGTLPKGFSSSPKRSPVLFDVECPEAKGLFNYVDGLRKADEAERKNAEEAKKKAIEEDWQNKIKWALKEG
ncbi:MAG: hypothetical protein HZB68_03305 [Candidatus Aenigmarchaeota archaeon]|nr:hypothetical protein [Candidatus Aenigmarchaeota archaeon]